MPECRPFVVHSRGEIGATNAVPALAEFVVGIDQANARSFAQVLRGASHRNQGALFVERIAGRHGLSRLPIVDDEETDIGVAHFSGDASTVFGVHNGARKGQIDSCGKVIRVFQKERP